MSARDDIAALHRVAQQLYASQQARFGAALAPLPSLMFLTDPERTPDAAALAQRLPPGAAVVYRAFGASDAVHAGLALARVAERRGLTLLVGADPRLARRIGADGVHLPERLGHRAQAILSGWPQALVTAAAHSRSAVERARRHGAQAVLLSPVFASGSPSAGVPLGRIRFGSVARSAALPVYALGGVNVKTAPELLGSGAVGLAAVSALA